MDTEELFEYQIQKVIELQKQQQKARKDLENLWEQIATAKNTLRITRETRDKIRAEFKQEIQKTKQEIKQALDTKNSIDKLLTTDRVMLEGQIIQEKYNKQVKEIETNKQCIEKQKRQIENLKTAYNELKRTHGLALATPEKILSLQQQYQKLLEDIETEREELQAVKKEHVQWKRNLSKLKTANTHESNRIQRESYELEQRYSSFKGQLTKKENRIKKIEQNIIRHLSSIKTLEERKDYCANVAKDLSDLLVCDDNGFYVEFSKEL